MSKIKIVVILCAVMFFRAGFNCVEILTRENPETWRVAASSIAATGFGLFFLLSLRGLWLERKAQKDNGTKAVD